MRLNFGNYREGQLIGTKIPKTSYDPNQSINQSIKHCNDFNNIDYYIYIEDMSIRSTHLDYWI